MATPENKSQQNPAHPQRPESLAPPGRISDGIHTVAVTKQDDILFVQVSRGEQSVFSAAMLPDTRVHLVFDPAQVGSPLEPQAFARLGQEPKKEPEHPAITLEGFPVRGAQYDKETRTYSLTIAHHPNPNRRKEEVVYYDLVAAGDNAEECYQAYVTDTRAPVRVTGYDLSYTQKRKGKPDRIVHKIQADSVEKIKGRLDGPDILREKVRLADLE